jgi:hypothetical protein
MSSTLIRSQYRFVTIFSFCTHVRLSWHVLCFQHREGIYWCPTPLRDKDQHSYKVCNVADIQVAPAPPIEEYISDSTVGSDDEATAT